MRGVVVLLLVASQALAGGALGLESETASSASWRTASAPSGGNVSRPREAGARVAEPVAARDAGGHRTTRRSLCARAHHAGMLAGPAVARRPALHASRLRVLRI